jgi:hypothetical protein
MAPRRVYTITQYALLGAFFNKENTYDEMVQNTHKQHDMGNKWHHGYIKNKI